MNRIILIGNGFDLAHNMETKYEHFINDYWDRAIKEIKKNQFNYENEELHITTRNKKVRRGNAITEYHDELENFYDTVLESVSFRKLKKQIGSFNNSNNPNISARVFGSNAPVVIQNYFINLQFKNKFLEHISEKLNLQTWVDIENEYYAKLKEYISDRGEIQTLNRNFEAVQHLLEKYLLGVEANKKIDPAIVSEIGSKIYSKISIQDLTISYKDDFIKEISSRIERLSDEGFVSDLNAVNNSGYGDLGTEADENIMNYVKIYSLMSEEDRCDYIYDDILREKINSYFLIPKSTLFLNFNYTDTHHNYCSTVDRIGIESIQVHGKLNYPSNPIIFGYGDELDEDYKKIENLNDNRFMENIKSTKYNETDNYRRLSTFIESGMYQVYVMGHSCGNSDRTLLNMLFEHDNCVSIKPFYHEFEKDGKLSNNYREIVRNISRNFTDKQKLRLRVVNKTYCQPLVSVAKEVEGQ